MCSVEMIMEPVRNTFLFDWGKRGQVRDFIVFIGFAIVILLELFGNIVPYSLLIATAILALFGFVHLFAHGAHPVAGGTLNVPHGGMNRVVLGFFPLVLAAASLPQLIGGSSFGDIIGEIPLLGWIAPGNLAGWVRYVLLIGIACYYHFVFLRSIAGSTGQTYGAIGGAAAARAGAAGTAARPHAIRVFIWILLVGAIYALENSSSLLGYSLGDADYGGFITLIGLFIVGFVMLFRPGFFSKLLGGISLVLALPVLGTIVPFGYVVTDNFIFKAISIGATSYIRYGFIAILLFYFMFRGQAWAQQTL